MNIIMGSTIVRSKKSQAQGTGSVPAPQSEVPVAPSASEMSTCAMARAPDLVLLRIASFLPPEDVARMAQTCRRLYAVLPRFLAIRGKDFHISGPSYGESVGRSVPPEPYFDGPRLPARVKRLTTSVVWKDQGWGNRKGEIIIYLMRGSPAKTIAEKSLFGIAPHEQETAKAELRDHPVVTEAQLGDYYHFKRLPGQGGGHQLSVKNFKVIAELK